MKIFTSLLSMLAVASAAPAADIMSVADLSQFQQDKPSLMNELQAWKKSEAGQFAKARGFYVEPKTPQGVVNTAAVDDQLRRLFQTKKQIQQLQLANPNANFSTNSPFTLMTNVEFIKFVGDSYGRNDTDAGDASALWDAPFANASEAMEASELSKSNLLGADQDWTSSGCVAGVKSQGRCGSCWAFAAVGALESAWCLKGNGLTLLSEQHLTSCDSNMGGCRGGFPGDALHFVQQNGGLCSGADYPYTSGESGEQGECASQQCQVMNIPIRQVVMVPASENRLIQALRGRPVAVGVAAGNPTWKQYSGGVISSCDSNSQDHAVLAVGFGGSQSDAPFFKIKNSWGTSWGEGGYVRLQRGAGSPGTCGIIGPKSAYPIV